MKIAVVIALFCFAGLTQSNAQISGILLSPKGEPVNGADVFINHTKSYSTTDEEGRFNLQDIPQGYLELIAYKSGFAMYRKFMRVSMGQSYNLSIQFPSIEKTPKGKSSPATEEAFNRAVLGTEGLLFYLEGTRVVPESRDGKFRILSGPVVVEYPAAGYRIIAFFSASSFQQVTEAACLYQDLQITNVTEKLGVEKTRQRMFKGSIRHWLRSTVQGTAVKEGFQHGEGAVIAVTPDSLNSLFRIHCPSPMKLTYEDQASVITTTQPIEANSNGLLLNPAAVRVESPQGRQGLAYQLPLDYLPIDDIEAEFSEALRYFYEKTYVHTDKAYYHPGESIWFKAYLNYYQRHWRDSLSNVLFVELLNSAKEIVVDGRYRIEEGVSQGDFILPHSLAEGRYFLRAYTNLRLNFGDSGLFTKPVHVLDFKSRVKPDPGYRTPPDASLTIKPAKDIYRIRDKIVLDIQLDSALKSANLSVSVTDAAQVIPLREENILDTYDINPGEIATLSSLSHRIEKGVSFDGQFLNDQDVGEKALLSFFQLKTGDVLIVETENDGTFRQTGLRFPDSTQFSWKSEKAKGRPYGKVVIQPRKIPSLETVVGPTFDIILAESAQPLLSDYEVPAGNKLLETVEIVGASMKALPKEGPDSRPFGKADYVMTSGQLTINSGSLLLALIGKVPGLRVDPTQRVIYFSRTEASSILNSGLPMVTLNDVPMAGNDPYTILESLDFNTVESIEFHNRINSLYGTAGAFGVIAVYTKTGEAVVGKTDPTLQTIFLPGFSMTRTFKSPDYGGAADQLRKPDNRSTLFWSPDVHTNPANGTATVSFFASDRAGMYRVVVEGVTGEGWPVRAETFLIVEE